EAGRVAVGWRWNHQVLGRRQEHARRIFQDFLRPHAERHVLALPAIQLRQQDLEVCVERRAVERITVALAKLAEPRVARGLAGTGGIFIAADTDAFDSGRGRRTLLTAAALTALQRNQLDVRLVLTAARGHELSGRKRSARPQP